MGEKEHDVRILDAKPFILEGFAGITARKPGQKVLLFTHSGAFFGTPQEISSLQKGIEGALEKIEKTREQQEPDLPNVRFRGGETIELKEAEFWFYTVPEIRIKLPQVFVFTEAVVGVAPAESYSISREGSS